MDEHAKGIRNLLLILTIIVIFTVLKLLSGLLIPLVLAGLLTILGLPIVNFLDKRRVPRVLITLTVAIVSLGLVIVVALFIGSTVNQIIEDKEFLASQFSKKINIIMLWIEKTLPAFDLEMIKVEIDTFFAPARIAGILGTILGSLGNFGSSFVLFSIYYLILISGATGYRVFISYVTGPEPTGQAAEVWQLTQNSISAYMSIKTVISLAGGVVAGLVCWAFGLQFALFWGFLTFVLNYIPSLGSIIATVFPIFMAVIQFDSFGTIVLLTALLILTQFILGNILDPLIMGDKLKLNAITVIFGLLFWGYIWEIPGMLLSVPLMVMMKLLLERTEGFAIIARIMGSPEKPRNEKSSLFSRIIDGKGRSKKKSKSDQ